MNFLNPPYSKAKYALALAAFWLLRGCSSLILVPAKSLNTEFGRKVIEALGFVYHVPPMTFQEYDTALELNLVAVLLITPEDLTQLKER